MNKDGLHLLVVAESAEERQEVVAALAPLFPSLVAVEAGDEATYRRALLSPDLELVITGHPLPWGDGLSVVGDVATLVATLGRSIPVILFSSHLEPGEGAAALEAGAADVVRRAGPEAARLPYAARGALALSAAGALPASPQERSSLQRAESILAAVSYSARHLLAGGPWEEQIPGVLARLGRVSGVSRAYLFRNSLRPDGTVVTSQLFEWADEGIPSELANPVLQQFRWQEHGMGYWQEQLAAGRIFSGHVRTMSPPEQELLAAQGIRSILNVPIFVGEEWWGLIGFDECRRERVWSEAEKEALRAAAGIIAAAIEADRLGRRAREEHQRLQVVHQIDRALLQAQSPEAIAAHALDQLRSLIPVSRASVVAFNYDTELAVILATVDQKRTELGAGTTIPLAAFGIDDAFRQGEPSIIQDLMEVPHDAPVSRKLLAEGIRSYFSLPLLAQDELIGLANFGFLEPHAVTPERIETGREVASTLAVAIQQRRLMQADRQHMEQLEAVRRFGLEIAGQLDLDLLLQAIVTRAVELVGADAGGLYLYRPEKDRLEWSVVVGPGLAPPGTLLARNEGLSGKVWAQDRPLIVHDYDQWEGRAQVYHDYSFASVAAVPVRWGEEFLGVLDVVSATPHRFGQPQADLLSLLAAQAAIAIVNARLFDETRRRAGELEALLQVSAALRPSLTLESTLPAVLDQIMALMMAEGASISLADPASGELEVHLGRGVWAANVGARLPAGQGISARVMASGQPFVSDDARHVAALLRPELLAGITAVACAPLIVEQKAVGTLWVGRQAPFSEHEIRLLLAISDIAASAMNRSTLYERTVAQARQMQEILDTVPEGMLLLDQEGRVLLANPTAQKLLAELSSVPAGQPLERLGDTPLPVLLAPVGEGMPWHELRLPQGERLFEAVARPLSQGWILVLREVTLERKQQAYLQNQERLATVGQLAAGIAHDFNNILASIVLYAQLLLYAPELSERAREQLNTIYRQGQHAASLIRQILDFSRRSVMERKQVDLLPFLTELTGLLQRTLPENIFIAFDYRPGSYLVRADPTRLQQVVINLALNARDAMPDGGVLHITLDRLVLQPGVAPPVPDMGPGRWLRLEVADEGTGILPEHQAHIFEPFFTTKQPGQGTGLGLAQVYGIVRQHEGFIDFSSMVGQGTVFTIYLPALEQSSFTLPRLEPDAAAPGKGERILLVEDDAEARRAISQILTVLNYEVVPASNGRSAEALFAGQAEEIALVVSDLVMPGLDGAALYDRLRAIKPDVKMVLMTGYPLEAEGKSLLERGLLAWIQKPFTAEAIASVLAEALA